jgi:cytochrome c oxidase subunit 2
VEETFSQLESAQESVADRRPRSRKRALALAIAAPVLLGGCELPSFGAFHGVTKTANSTFKLWQGFNVTAIVVGGITLLAMIWAIFAYRAKDTTSIPKQTQYHIPLELTYTIIPIFIVIGLFAATVVVENQVVNEPAPNATINVTAFQWGWKFTYPGHKAVVVGQTTQSPIMVMPENQNVHINLRSTDVIHGFYVPEFNFSRYAQPGLLNTFTFNANKTGLFAAQCTQLCGLYHSLMYFRVAVVTQSQFAAWLKATDSATSQQQTIDANGAIALQINPGVKVNPTKSNGDGAN